MRSAFRFFSICRLSTLRRSLLSASLGSEQCQRVKRRNERCGENINICDRITAPAERAERRARYRRVLATLLTSHKDPSVHPANHFTQQGGKKKKKKVKSPAHKASELNHSLICLWYKWALTYYLIMGFSAKPPSIAALQSTCLRRSADPTLGPPRDPGSCDLSGLLELMISQEGRRKEGWDSTGSCQQSSLVGAEPRPTALDRRVHITVQVKGPAGRKSPVWTWKPHLNFNNCLQASNLA